MTTQDWADVRAIAETGGSIWHAFDVDMVEDNPAALPVPILTGLIYVNLRRAQPRITAARCVRLALAYKEGAGGK